MTSIARTSISSCSRGHEFSAATFTIDPARVAAYLEATGNRTSYNGAAAPDTAASPLIAATFVAVPPLAAVALGLEALLHEVFLPEGSLHTGQEVEHDGILLAGDALKMNARVAQRSERQGYVISVIEIEVVSPNGASIRARTTIMAPGGAS